MPITTRSPCANVLNQVTGARLKRYWPNDAPMMEAGAMKTPLIAVFAIIASRISRLASMMTSSSQTLTMMFARWTEGGSGAAR